MYMDCVGINYPHIVPHLVPFQRHLFYSKEPFFPGPGYKNRDHYRLTHLGEGGVTLSRFLCTGRCVLHHRGVALQSQ